MNGRHVSAVVLEAGYFEWDPALVRPEEDHLAASVWMIERHRTGPDHMAHSFFADPVPQCGRADI
jgi:hypothetical protein